MKKANFKKLSRQMQKEVNGNGLIRKCKDSIQCEPGECCSGGICMLSPFPVCEPIE